MSFAPVTSHISAGAASFVDAFAGGLKSLIPGTKAPDSWVEIYPYGFVSRNYLNYIAGKPGNYSVSTLPDDCKVINFADGATIVHSEKGHMVELDRHRRVVMVRVTRAEAEGARLTLGMQELSKCYRSTTNDFGQPVVIMPGNIVIVEDGWQIKITFPNGTEFFARKNVA